MRLHALGIAVKRALALAMILFPFALPARAQISSHRRGFPGKVGHFVSRHELLISDTVIAYAFAADVASSMNCQHVNPSGCFDKNSLLGLHPSDGRLIAWGSIATAIFITGDHLFWHETKRDGGKYAVARHAIWIATGLIAASEVKTVSGNVATARQVQIARHRLAQ